MKSVEDRRDQHEACNREQVKGRTAEVLSRELLRLVLERLDLLLGKADEREDEVLDEGVDVWFEEGEHSLGVDAAKGGVSN
jgi:hypothetical protein